jgi:transposase
VAQLKRELADLCHMERFLTARQVSDYKYLHKRCASVKERDRIKAILMLNSGYSFEEVANVLIMDEDSIRRWHKLYDEGGIEALSFENYKGSDSFLTTEQQTQLSSHLEEHIFLTAKEVCEYARRIFKIEYSSKGMTNLLHRMGFTYKKAKAIPGKADRAAQIKFIKKYKALKKSKGKEDKIYFMDGSHPLHNSIMQYGWIKKGEEKFIESNTGRDRININGAYNVETKQVIAREDESINAQSTVKLLMQLLSMQPNGKLYIILDNARYYHSQVVKEFIRDNPRIKFKFLPPYSPNLNLIERIWKFVKKKVSYNKYYEKFSVFRTKFMNCLNKLDRYKNELETLMTEKFQLFPT